MCLTAMWATSRTARLTGWARRRCPLRLGSIYTGRDRVEVFDHDARRHLPTLPGFPEAAGVVAENGDALVTNRGGASLSWIDARTLKTRASLA
jgi:hypothetical protein